MWPVPSSPLLTLPHPDRVRDRLRLLYAETRYLRRLLPIAEAIHEHLHLGRVGRSRDEEGSPCAAR